jgi:biotin-dependent carboxylase-like uncharacterized protein
MLKVISPGFYTSIQDLGRVGHAHFGVSRAGIMDKKAASWANFLLQNESNCAVLEVTFGACVFEFLADTHICITGADFSASLNGEIVQLYKPIQVKSSSMLIFGERKFGVRTYIAVKGGFKTPSVLGSRSFFKGITQNSKIEKGDLIPFESAFTNFKSSNSIIKIDTSYFKAKEILSFEGPEYYLLTEKQKSFLQKTIFTISTSNNRMGYQLNEVLENDLPSMLTSAVLPGTVQLTPSGKLIILMSDCQVTGGYPRVLQLKEASINALAQKTTGDSFQFTF